MKCAFHAAQRESNLLIYSNLPTSGKKFLKLIGYSGSQDGFFHHEIFAILRYNAESGEKDLTL